MFLQKVVGLEIHVWQVWAHKVPPIQTQCQYPTLKRDPLFKVKHSLVWCGFCFCFHYIDISKAASPVTFLGNKLSAHKPQGIISHGVISFFFIYLFTVFQSLSMHNGPCLPLHQGPACRVLGCCCNHQPLHSTSPAVWSPAEREGKERWLVRDLPL